MHYIIRVGQSHLSFYCSSFRLGMHGYLVLVGNLWLEHVPLVGDYLTGALESAYQAFELWAEESCKKMHTSAHATMEKGLL